jgi:Uma2 family endonuclease
MSAVAEKFLTFEEFLARPDHFFFELVDGKMVQTHVSLLSSNLAIELASRLTEFCRRHDLGKVFGPDLYYRCFPNKPKTGRRPDVTFIRKDRLPPDWQQLGYATIAPDLAVEVISTHDLAREVSKKLVEYRNAEVPLVWVIDPENRLADVHRLNGSVQRLSEEDYLSGEDVIPDFTVKLAELFPA